MSLIPYKEEPLHYNEQLQRLKSRGLIIEDEEKALHLLENISYFRLSNYWYPLLAFPKTDKIFKPAATFNTAFNLYCFDRELRKLVNGELEKIEIAIRANESWLHCLVYVRNICAHHARLWNRTLSISPQIPLKPLTTWLKTVEIENNLKQSGARKINNRTYFLLSMIIFLLNTINPNHSFSRKIKELIKDYPLVDIGAMGFTKNWELEEL